MDLFKILNANNYFSVNRIIAHKIGLSATIFMSELLDKLQYFEEKGLLSEEWFYLTVETVQERTTLGKDAQTGAIKVLKELGLIDCKAMGMPAKRHFKVFKEKFLEWVLTANKKEETRQQEGGEHTNKLADNPPTAPIYKSPTEEPNIVCTSPTVAGKAKGIVDRVSKKHPDGHMHEITLEEVFKQAVLQRKSWTGAEINDAWKILVDYRGEVREFVGYIEGTIANRKNEKKGQAFANHKRNEQCQKIETDTSEICKKSSSGYVTMGQILQEFEEKEKGLKNSTTGYGNQPIHA